MLARPLLARRGRAPGTAGTAGPPGPGRAGPWPSCEACEQLVLLKMAAGTWSLFLLVSSLDAFVPVTRPAPFSWGFLILTQRLPRYTGSGCLLPGHEGKPVT